MGGANLQEKVVECPPRGRAGVPFLVNLGDLGGGIHYLGRFSNKACVLRPTTKNVNFFGEENLHPRQNPDYAYIGSLSHERCRFVFISNTCSDLNAYTYSHAAGSKSPLLVPGNSGLVR